MKARKEIGLLVALLAIVLIVALAACQVEAPPPEADESESPVEGVDPKVRERIGFKSGVDSWFYNGADMYMYSDEESTQVLHLDGATPAVTIGGASAEDTKLVYDGNAQDYYVALDDSADDLLIGLGSTVGTTGIAYFDENQDFGLGGASAGAKLDVTGNVFLDGAADEIQLVVSGYTTQTTGLLVLEQSDGTDVVTVSNAGNTVVVGTLGVTGNFAVNTNKFAVTAASGNTDAAGTLQYGANDLYPVGYGSSGQQLVYGTDSITGTATAAHGLTTVTFCMCTLGEDPTNGAGDAAMCTTAVSANVCTVKAWQDDFVTAATETGVAVHWLVVGAP